MPEKAKETREKKEQQEEEKKIKQGQTFEKPNIIEKSYYLK